MLLVVLKMPTATVNLTNIPLLTSAEGYQDWSAAVITSLRIHGVWRYVTGEYTKPEIPTTVQISRPPAEKAQDISISIAKEKLRQWQDSDDKAYGIICQALSHSIKHEVMNKSSSKSVWDYLESKYNVSCRVLSFEGLQDVTHTRYDDCSGVGEYVTKLTAALEKLDQSLGDNYLLPEPLKIQYLLGNLGDSWNVFLTLYLSTRFQKGKTSFHEVVHDLIQEEMHIRMEMLMANVKAHKDRKCGKHGDPK